jgi:hypothetical protein
MLYRLTLLALAPLALATPAAAQQGAPTERINQVIVYGDDACPQATDDTIVVCARLAEDERYRIPPTLRGDPNDPRRESWTARVQSLERVGRFGTDSCSPVGLGGFTGCTRELVDNFGAERTANNRAEWTNAVEEARRRRVEGFDAAAAEEESDIVARENAAAAAVAARDRAAAAADADIARGQSVESDAVEAATPLPQPNPPR